MNCSPCSKAPVTAQSLLSNGPPCGSLCMHRVSRAVRICAYIRRVYAYTYTCPCAGVNAVRGPFFREAGLWPPSQILSLCVYNMPTVSTIRRPRLPVVILGGIGSICIPQGFRGDLAQGLCSGWGPVCLFTAVPVLDTLDFLIRVLHEVRQDRHAHTNSHNLPMTRVHTHIHSLSNKFNCLDECLQ